MSDANVSLNEVLLDLVKGQAQQSERLESISTRIDSQSSDLIRLSDRKDESHRLIYDRLDSLEASRDRLLGLAFGIGIGAGAVGGGVGAVVSSILG